MIANIYKLEGGGKFYIGSTTAELNKRLKKHKCKSNENIAKSRRVYTYFKEIGWNNVHINLIKEVTVNNRHELLVIETEEIKKVIDNPECLNSILPTVTKEEKKYRDSVYSKKRRQDNPERERTRLQKWRKENPEKRNQQVIREHLKKNLT